MPKTSPSTKTPPDYIDLAEVAQVMHLALPVLRRYIRVGRVPRPDVDLTPRCKLWHRDRFLKWLAEQAAAAAKGVADALQPA
jgi:predicted DNA-binding transcriptional regulator AlpA